MLLNDIVRNRELTFCILGVSVIFSIEIVIVNEKNKNVFFFWVGFLIFYLF